MGPRHNKKCALALAGMVAGLSVSLPALAATQVLAIGINFYEYELVLDGAVADAEDIAQTLAAQGASVTKLLDKDASRARIISEWQRMVGAAKSGDTIVLSYAGHGGQEPDSGVLDETDGKDEALLLSGFNRDTAHPGYAERIVDDEIHDWLADAGKKGIKVIFVADACHSGTLTRSVDSRVKLKYRSSPPYGAPVVLNKQEKDKLAATVGPVADARDKELLHVTFFSATSEDLQAPEVDINNQSRGALSYAFSRGMEGAADSDGDGIITRYELVTYVAPQVRQLSEARQSAEMKPRGGGDVQVFSLGKDRIRLRPGSGAPAAAVNLATLKLAVQGVPEGDAQKLVGRLNGVEFAAGGSSADLVWDAVKGDVISGLGDPVAHDIAVDRLQGIVDRWRTLDALKKMMATHSMDVSVLPGDGRHAAGSKVSVHSAALAQGYAAAIDLAPDGSMNLLYPLPSDSPTWPKNEPYKLDDINVQEPYGVDHVLLISSSKDLRSLFESRKTPYAHVLTMSVLELPSKLQNALAGSEYKIGLAPVYTWKGN